MHHTIRETVIAVIDQIEAATGLTNSELLANDDTGYADPRLTLHDFAQSVRHILDTLETDRRTETLVFLRLELQHAEQTAHDATKAWLEALFADSTYGPDGTPQ
ncbi:hypothetical protein [Kitasatospora sp. MAP5-34]|uniref:hypothetical protein n=1 Tax=Kitasatospora sp. MAP5-34 TaxID=3035102 RepID=UPI0024731C7F|nr:hypothetical protein [Kitasatospora sp. MAP5-34]MDH6580733.1 hypothetical protein [Kitasatospora sp. MAP5-34]